MKPSDARLVAAFLTKARHGFAEYIDNQGLDPLEFERNM